MYQKPEKITLQNDYILLSPMTTEDSIELFQAASECDDNVFYHMFFGPFRNVQEVEVYIKSELNKSENIVFKVFSKRLGKTVGSCSIINVDSTSGNAEIGSIWYINAAQRTEINSITIYLLLEYLFEKLQYRRIVWKCDNENVSSKAAAKVLGFEYEGLFRKHLIIKGRNRDTIWFSILDDNWQEKKNQLKKRIEQKLANIA